MARRMGRTRVELRRQREILARYERFLPALEMRQQQLQLAVRRIAEDLAGARAMRDEARAGIETYAALLADPASVSLERLATPRRIETESMNVAGVTVPVFLDVEFPAPGYGLFNTPAWVDRALTDLRELRRIGEAVRILEQQHALLYRELVRVIQRVNLFEKVKIPEAQEAVRRIRVHLGDEMAVAVGRAKIAKRRLSGAERTAGQAKEVAG